MADEVADGDRRGVAGQERKTTPRRYCFCQMLDAEDRALRGDSPIGSDAPHRTVLPSSAGDGTASEPCCEDGLQGGVLARLHSAKRSALCLSGGGIRSATFALGILQGLAHHQWLERFDYLSTVSGGGYIGSWLSSWVNRHGRDDVFDALRDTASPEPPPVRHLRAFSNYLTPQYGLFTTDTWTLIATYFRNVFLMWLLFVPLLFAVLLLPRISVGLVNDDVGLGWTYVVGAVGAGLAVVAIFYIGSQLPSEQGEHGQGQRDFLLRAMLPLLASSVLLTSSWAWWRHQPEREPPGLDLFIVFGIVVHLVATVGIWVTRLRRRGTIFSEASAPLLTKWMLLLGELVAVIVVGTCAGALGGAIAKLAIFAAPLQHPVAYVVLAFTAYLAIFGIGGMLLAGILSRWTMDEDREWWARAGAWIMIAAGVWPALAAVTFYGPLAILYAPKAVAAVGGISGLFALVMGWSSKTGSQPRNAEQATDAGASSLLADYGVAVAAPAFAIFLLAALSLATDSLPASWTLDPGYHAVVTDAMRARQSASRVEARESVREKARALDPVVVNRQANELGSEAAPKDDGKLSTSAVHRSIIASGSWKKLTLWAAAAVAFSLFASWLINPNRFSLHAMYRNRLIRAYLGASRLHRAPHPFTGFDADDNLRMHELGPKNPSEPVTRPMHVVNIALNLVAGHDLAWQERKAESFTVSPLHCGSRRHGYRDSAEYGGAQGISLGTAVTISGAAASPNMGYNSSPVLAFLMTLFNVRLGAWLGNPGPYGDESYRNEVPGLSVLTILQEALGLTDARRKYVYLSDGGHFENLGIYEMVLRRCRVIVVSDAGCDPGYAFDDLGNAIRKIRIDFGIPIEFTPVKMPMFPRATDSKLRARYAVARIRYSAVDGASADDGFLLYLKATLCDDESPDVTNYATTAKAFPHESTVDQWFSETQFESYRMLGFQTAATLLRPPSDPPSPLDLLLSGWNPPTAA